MEQSSLSLHGQVIEKSWLSKELHIPNVRPVTADNALRAMSAAAILACSDNQQHRHAAYRLATYVFELFEPSDFPFDAALRVVLTRLGNFPAVRTRSSVLSRLTALPWTFAADELFVWTFRQYKLAILNVLTDF